MAPSGTSSPLVAIAVSLATLLSGCLGGSPGASAPAPDACSDPAGDVFSCLAGVPATSVKLGECSDGDAAFEVPAEDVKRLLPPEFEPNNLYDGAVGVVFEIEECKEVSVNGVALEGPVRMAHSRALVSVNDSLATSGVYHYYLFESYATDPALVQAMREAGLPATEASIEFESTLAGPQGSVRVGDALLYELAAGTGLFGPSDSFPDVPERWHHRADGAPSSWMERDYSNELTPNMPTQSRLQVQGGALAKLQTASGGHLVGFAQPRTWDATATFERLCPSPADLRISPLSYEWPFPGDGEQSFPLAYTSDDAASRILIHFKMRGASAALPNEGETAFSLTLMAPNGTVMKRIYGTEWGSAPGEGDGTFGLEGTWHRNAWEVPVDHVAGDWTIRIEGRGIMRTDFEVQTTGTGFGC